VRTLASRSHDDSQHFSWLEATVSVQDASQPWQLAEREATLAALARYWHQYREQLGPAPTVASPSRTAIGGIGGHPPASTATASCYKQEVAGPDDCRCTASATAGTPALL